MAYTSSLQEDARMASEECAPSLMMLPDDCLLAVLQHCAANGQRSVFSAARAHSRLYTAASKVLLSITARPHKQQQMRGVLTYLSKHGANIGSVDLKPSGDFEGVRGWGHFPTASLLQMQQLTCLELADLDLIGPDDNSPPLQPLQALTRLADLRLKNLDEEKWAPGGSPCLITSSMLSGAHHLTRLQLSAFRHNSMLLEPGVLAGKTKLQHLSVLRCKIHADSLGRVGDAAPEEELMSQMQHLQQLTYIDMSESLTGAETCQPAAYSALTASSKLQHLNISRCYLPVGLWQHMFPAGRQLPHLHTLDIGCVVCPTPPHLQSVDASGVNLPTAQLDYDGWVGSGPWGAPAPQGNLLVSCCPGLQSLDMSRLQHVPYSYDSFDVGRLLPLTQLKQLTKLHFAGPYTQDEDYVQLRSGAPGDEPVWFQLQLCIEKALANFNLSDTQDSTVESAEQQQNLGSDLQGAGVVPS